MAEQMAYNEDTQKAVRRVWDEFKSETGTSQAKAAKALGINQSALSQYLRGEIPLNTDFLAKFAKLTKSDLDSLGITPATVGAMPLELRYTLSGRRLRDTSALVPSPTSFEGCFGIVVDYDDFALPRDSIMIVDETTTIKEYDSVILVSRDDRMINGTIRYTPDGWEVLEPHARGARRFVVGKDDTIYRLGGAFLPERHGRTFEQKPARG